MLKRILAAISLGILAPACALATPYFTVWPTKAEISHPQTSIGAVMDERGVVQNAAFTSVAVVYHPADPATSIIPEVLRPYIPPESWTLLSVGYGGGLAGAGSSVNLAATIQGYVSQAFLASGKPGLQTFGTAIKPGASALSINAGPEWFSTVIRGGTMLPFDQWKGTPGWFIGGAYKF